MIGLPCSGKSTLAQSLGAEQATLRLSPDEWISRLGLDLTPASRERLPAPPILPETPSRFAEFEGPPGGGTQRWT